MSEWLISLHLGSAHFFKIGMKEKKMPIEKEWECFGETLQLALNQIMETLKSPGMVVAIEMHPKKKGRPNGKELRPYARIVVYACDTFLKFPITKIEPLFTNNDLNIIKSTPLNTNPEIVNATCYCMKSAKQGKLIKVTQHFYKKQPLTLIINDQLKVNPLVALEVSLKLYTDIKYELEIKHQRKWLDWTTFDRF